MPFSAISPFRQLKHAYGSLLRLSHSAEEISRTLRTISYRQPIADNVRAIAMPETGEKTDATRQQSELFERLAGCGNTGRLY